MSHPLSPVSLLCEFRNNPIGLDARSPRLSWRIDALGAKDVKQSAYQILVDGGKLWDTGKVQSSSSNQIVYAGAPLQSGQTVHWKVRVWNQDDVASDWSPDASWMMGLLNKEDWTADWIGLSKLRPGVKLYPPAYLRRTFVVSKPIESAMLYATARGVYLPYLNGDRIGDTHFAPGWTEYSKRIAYQTDDVTEQVVRGENVLGTVLGYGWYNGFIAWDQRQGIYGSRPQMLAQLVLTYSDGSKEVVGTDSAWIGSEGPIEYSDFQMGEYFDARLDMPEWSAVGFDPSSWRPVTLEKDHVPEMLRVAQIDPPIRVTQELPSSVVTEPILGTYIFDLKQNMVGWARLKVSGPAGTVVRMRFGETLNPDGTLYVANLRGAESTDTYILAGSGVETFEPHFTFHGFRFVEITGYPGAPSLDAVTGVVLHSDTPVTGTFTCGDPLVNQLVSNIDWGQRGNFISIPTDCPQRDERLGWMGDAQIFVRTAAANRDVVAFFEKWMYDVVDAQSDAGAYCDISPRLKDLGEGVPAWADAGVIVPWTIYQVYADKRILETNYDSMSSWIDFLVKGNPDHLWLNNRSSDYGDWLSINADTSKDLLASAYFAYDVSLMAKIAAVLGKTTDAAKYDALFEKIKEAFNKTYVSADGKLTGETQTAYVLALRFNLLSDELRSVAARHLADDIAAKNGHLSTGFVGVGYLCPVLSDTGQSALAFDLLLNKTFPSWGYSIEHGATTIWERWDGWTTEKGFQDVGMNSFNHYSLGSVGEWLQRYVAGIDTDPDRPGFDHILLKPHVDKRLGFVRATFESVHGLIASSWEFTATQLVVKVTIPANTTATLTLPDVAGTVYQLGSGSYEFSI